MAKLNGKTYRWIERVIKGFANHRRVQIMDLLDKKPELSVEEISDELKVNLKTISAHIQKLAISGIVLKRSDNKEVRHKLAPRGEVILTFLRMLE